ncbi:MAG TPA: 6-phosphogluconolactonase [Polyangiaceae bacterium]|nr:6-phosphogluconolactonase [Polyangiaceae bacterium]
MNRSREIVVVESSELAAIAAHRIAQLIREVGQRRPTVSLALAGGGTPRAMHEKLVLQTEMPWQKLSIFFGDERSVPPDSPDSNYRMARESLLDHIALTDGQIHRMRAEAPDRDASARAYEAELPSTLDLLILGIGEDGHTASLFPGAAAMGEQERRVLPVVGPKPPPHRLTITPPVIAAAERVVVLASGAGKAGPVQRALEGDWDPLQTPAQLAREALWIVDSAAAAQLA